MLDAYLQHEKERNAQGIPALPLTPDQTTELCKLLQSPPTGREELLLHLFRERIAPGVDAAARVKADFLGEILKDARISPLIDKTEAIRILGTMIGGYNVRHLVDALGDNQLTAERPTPSPASPWSTTPLTRCLNFQKPTPQPQKSSQSWAAADWFAAKPELPATFTLKAFKVEGEINTDDFSPAGDAWSRPDIPLHALAMGKTRFPGGIDELAAWRAAGHRIAFVGDVLGTGSSRKSACNSVLWYIGEDIPAVPNKRRGGVILGSVIAPIFFNTAEDSGALPLRLDVSRINHGDIITVHTREGKVTDAQGETLATFTLQPATLADEYRAGGRIPLIIGRALTARAREALGLAETDIFANSGEPYPAKEGQGFTLAQKIVGKACGIPGVLPGTACEPEMTTVGSQDTTGPMTADELKELACLRFQAPMFMQSFCHTAAYPKPADVAMHKILPGFVSERGGVSLKPGDGVIHSWINRLLVPDTVGTGGDSHTRFPIGISFPAGSGLVAFAGALGFMPLDMPESVLVRFKGKLRPGITLRDVVNAIPYFAIKAGKLTVPKKNKVNVFNGRILEMEGLEDLSVEQAFELTDATAERSAAAACIQLSEKSVADFLRSNAALMKKMIADGYQDAETLRQRIEEVEAWLARPQTAAAPTPMPNTPISWKSI